MKNLLVTCAIVCLPFVASCDPQSDMAKKGVEKFTSPTPSITPTPTEAPIDQSAVVSVDTSVAGPTLNVNPTDKKAIVCDKYNRVMVNGSGQAVKVTGACRQLMVNGNENEVTAEAAMEIVFNGRRNTVRYSRYANGKRPVISGNAADNVVEEAAVAANR